MLLRVCVPRHRKPAFPPYFLVDHPVYRALSYRESEASIWMYFRPSETAVAFCNITPFHAIHPPYIICNGLFWKLEAWMEFRNHRRVFFRIPFTPYTNILYGVGQRKWNNRLFILFCSCFKWRNFLHIVSFRNIVNIKINCFLRDFFQYIYLRFILV